MTQTTAKLYKTQMASYWPFIIIAIWYLPFLILGEKAGILIHDNLDSVVTWYKILLDKNLVFAGPGTEIPGIMQGLLRSSLPGYDIAGFLFETFGMYYGYVMNKLVMSVVAYCGMLMLLKKFIPAHASQITVLRTTSLIYALLPFWSVTLSVAGLPLVFAAFIQLYKNEKILASALLILLYGLGSSLVLTGIFIFFIGGIFWIAGIIRKKRIPYAFTAGFILLALAFTVSHYPVITSTLIKSDYISHRTEMHTAGGSFIHAIKEMLQIGLLGQLHAQSLHTLLLVPLLILLCYMWRKNSITPSMYWIMAFIITTGILYGLLTWEGISEFKQKLMRVFPVQLQRFHFFHPMLWYLLFASASVFLIQHFRLGKKIWQSILLIQFLYITSYHEMLVNLSNPSFADFFAESTFTQIKHDNPDLMTNRCLSIGIHPAIAQWNGMNTLDGYFADYPLAYKHAFRPVIAPTLERDEKIRTYFDNWGSRCYAFATEVGTQLPLLRNTATNISGDIINCDAAINLGCRYIISGFPIQVSDNRMRHAGSYNTTTDLPIYVYEIY